MTARNTVHGEVWFNDENAKRISWLTRAYSSAMRSAYQAVHKLELKGNAVRNRVKKHYMPLLNQRYVADACMQAQAIEQEKSLFGGKRRWKMLQTGAITKEEWLDVRNGQIYSRGDKTSSGNPNIRVAEDELWVNDPSGRGKWIKGKLFLQKGRNFDPSCYDVRIIKKDGNRFSVVVSSEIRCQEIPFDASRGVIGVDINPDGVAVVETDASGNLLGHVYIHEGRIQNAGEGKRDNDIYLLAKKVIEIAKKKGKPIVLERLDFRKKKDSYRKFNRMKSNFLYRKMIEAVVSRAHKDCIATIDVHPAFTSVLGRVKYQKMYSLNRHVSAALVIGRRGMGIRERQTFRVSLKRTDGHGETDKDTLNLEGRGESIDLSRKAWSWLQDVFLEPKTIHPHRVAPGSSEEAHGAGAGEIPAGEPAATTDPRGIAEADDQGHGRDLGKIF